MNETAVKLRDCALTLENDSGFHDEYKSYTDTDAAQVRNIIKRHLVRNTCPLQQRHADRRRRS